MVTGRVLIPGRARGEALVLDAPISFWGGVSPGDGRIVDPRHPQHGATLTGTVLLIAETVGSSSSSSILLELLRQGLGPAALLLRTLDAVLPLGAVVAEELGYAPCPVLEIDWGPLEPRTGDVLRVEAVGSSGQVLLDAG